MTATHMRDMANKFERSMRRARLLLGFVTLLQVALVVLNSLAGHWKSLLINLLWIAVAQVGFYKKRKLQRSIAEMRLLAKLMEPVRER